MGQTRQRVLVSSVFHQYPNEYYQVDVVLNTRPSGLLIPMMLKNSDRDVQLTPGYKRLSTSYPSSSVSAPTRLDVYLRLRSLLVLSKYAEKTTMMRGESNSMLDAAWPCVLLATAMWINLWESHCRKIFVNTLTL